MPSIYPHRLGTDRRIVITGVGIVSPLGRTPERFWQSLIEKPTMAADRSGGETAVRTQLVADFDGQIDEFGELPAATRKTLRKSLKLMNRETQLGVAAGQQALASSRLRNHYDPDHVGVCFAADNVSIMPDDFERAVRTCAGDDGEFDMDRWGTDGLPEIAPLWLLKCLPNMPACHLAIINNLRGPSNTITQRDVAFALAVAEACRTIRSHDADAMLVGATGTTLSPFNLMHARLENEVADEPGPPGGTSADVCDQRPRPGEGAGALVLEELQAARDRGAHLFGEILSSTTASHIGHDGVAACGRALAGAMRQSLRRSRLSPADVGHIHAHGLGSEAMDRAESRAIADVFGPAARTVPIVATKNRMGHSGAGAGAMEVIASLLALEHGELFPAHRIGDPTSERPLRLVSDSGEPAGESFLSLSMFGRGLGGCITVGAVRE